MNALVQIPIFTQREIWVAECCALALWRGVSFETLNQIAPSDEVLLNNFDLGFQHAVKFPSQPSRITEDMVRNLIRVTDTTDVYRGHYYPDFIEGIKGIRNFGVQAYKAATSRPRLMSSLVAGKQALANCSTQWASGLTKVTYQTVLTTRILYFCMPEIAIYNFCTDFKQFMGLPKESHLALPDFNDLMFNGMARNRALLRQLRLPASTLIKKRSWNRISKSDWWQRRVLDLTLLIHYKIVVPHPSIVLAVRRRIRRSNRAQKGVGKPDEFCCISEIMPKEATKPTKGKKPKGKS